MSDTVSKTINVLLIEDNPGDALLVGKMLSRLQIPSSLKVIADGASAIAHCEKILRSEAELPDFILLDLNLPKVDGHAVLRKVKTSPVLKRTPVVILTSSHAEKDICNTYDAHANAFVVKPMNISDYYRLGELLETLWFRLGVAS